VRALKRLFLGVFLLALVMAAVAFALPRHVALERSVVINAPEIDIFPYVNNLKKFNEWSPWAARDPEMHYVFAGPVEGKGAQMEWDSSDFGTGEMEILESQPNKSVEVSLDFGDRGGAVSSYQLSPSGAGTKVTWGFRSDVGNNPIERWLALIWLGRRVGDDYEQGLARLKKLVEAESAGG
jgi:uncharacterized protein YndB with AHSA1/START domain